MLDELFDKAHATSDEDEAIAIYNEILLQKEDWSTVHYNLGLIHKYRREWKKSYKHNKRAVELDPDSEANHWNLGIAATMLGDWKVARECWNVFGLNYEIADKDTAYEKKIGACSIRINPNGKAETVWAKRICPARAVIESIPLPESEHNFNDIVINDGAANGHRTSDGVKYPVLDEIQHLTLSEYRTYSVKCKSLKDEDYKDLARRCREADMEIENWTTSITWLCKKCSEGEPHEKHDRELEVDGEQLIAFASRSRDRLKEILEAWYSETGNDYYKPHYYE